MEEELIIKENGNSEGSICGFESLNRLLESSLSPQVFKVTIIS